MLRDRRSWVLVLVASSAGLLAWATRSEATPMTTIAERIPFEVGSVLPALPPLRLASGEALGVKASDCGACHQANYDEWKGSTHAYAMRDPQYFAELSKPSSPRWLCLNCHAPTQNQRRILVRPETQLVDDPNDVSGIVEIANPDFDPEMQREGVTCATCHVRVEAGQSVVVASRETGRAPHPVRARPNALRSVCLRCHDPGPGTITPTFFCWFETAREGRAHGVQESCVECHMPPVTRSLVGESVPVDTRHHFWTGGGVPKTFDGYDTLLERGYVPGGELDARVSGRTLTVRLSNTRAGHHLTSADPERHVLVRTVTVKDGVEVVRDHREFRQEWDWGSTEPVRPARRIADSRIPAGESRSFSVALPAEYDVVRVEAAHVRLSPANARYMKKTRLEPSLRQIWPGMADAIRNVEDHYPLMTWFARTTYVARDARWVATPLPELLRESKALRGTALSEYDALTR